ncbi:hypothetical protein D030_0906B, partial [Vibrio parahaemolyticus AQ3810]
RTSSQDCSVMEIINPSREKQTEYRNEFA